MTQPLRLFRFCGVLSGIIVSYIICTMQLSTNYIAKSEPRAFILSSVYILLLGIMQFQKPVQIWADVKRTTIPLIISGLKLWPLAHCVTYGLVPVENRLLWVDIVEILWVTILATQASGGATDDEPAAEPTNEVAA